jgi:hypothetical protein
MLATRCSTLCLQILLAGPSQCIDNQVRREHHLPAGTPYNILGELNIAPEPAEEFSDRPCRTSVSLIPILWYSLEIKPDICIFAYDTV